MRAMLISSLIALAAATSASAQDAPQDPKPLATNPYAAYDWLIGDWYAKPGPGLLREQITYGPGRGYIRFSVFTAPNEAAPQHLHFEGIALWNAKTKVLDYLFAVEPGSGAQESGTYRAEPDGSIVREIELIDPKGNTGTFRQTFQKTGTDRAITTLFRKTESGWVPTFPGSERVELQRRPGTGDTTAGSL